MRDLLQVVWRRLWAVILVAVVLAGSAVGFSLLQTPTYEASIRILVGQERGITGTPNEVQGLQQLTLTMAEAVKTRPVAEAVIQRLDLEITPNGLLQNLDVQQVTSTQFIQVSYKDPDPERAQLIVNTVGEVFSEKIREVGPNASAITATVWEEAAVPSFPVSPNPLRSGLVALVLGGVLGVGLAFLLEQLDDRWRSPEEVEQISGVPTFGIVPEFRVLKSKKEGI